MIYWLYQNMLHILWYHFFYFFLFRVLFYLSLLLILILILFPAGVLTLWSLIFCATLIKAFYTLTLSLADVSKYTILFISANNCAYSDLTYLWGYLSILFPINNLTTLGEEYFYIYMSQFYN